MTGTAKQTATYFLGDKAWWTTTLDEERHEVFDGVLQAMRGADPDEDCRAACAYLLRHLARTSVEC
jgi:hypothetical protein